MTEVERQQPLMATQHTKKVCRFVLKTVSIGDGFAINHLINNANGNETICVRIY